tara:strand:+ start:398 stop:1402 length:1005 start_codon:yes stop_codon:yes gene_type:complete
MIRRALLGGFAAALAQTAIPAAALAQTPDLPLPADFPPGLMRMIVPYGSGGGSHAVAVAVSEELEKIVGRKVVVQTMPGRSGLDAVDAFMNKPPSALNILQHIDDAASAFAAGRMPFDPGVDWVPLGITQITFSQLYIRARDRRFKDWPSFLQYARDNPGFVKIGNVGNESSAEQVNIRLLEDALGIKVAQVGFDRPANRYMSVILGTVDALVEQPGDVRTFLDRGLYTPVLTFLRDRPSAFASTPSLRDIGAEFSPLLRFRGFFVRKGVPGNHVDFLETALRKVYDSSGYRAFNRRNYMHLLESYRDSQGAVVLINDAVASYRKAFKMMGVLK